MRNVQIFTPEHITYTMFNEIGYMGAIVRKKHIIDNSCGNGAILKLVVKHYINVCLTYNVSKEEIIRELETYIHGVEIDENLYNETINNLNQLANTYSLGKINWDIINEDTMYVEKYNGMMDYVIGNPPYCNIHDIEETKREKVKSFNFANGGMTDMYLVFFEIGIKMLNTNGRLIYITPNSWLTSKAGINFKKYLKESKTLHEIYQYGHKKIFDNATTYTSLTLLSKRPKKDNTFICYRNTSNSSCLMTKSIENLEHCMINDNIYLTDKETLKTLRQIDIFSNSLKGKKNRIRVKNGFATLKDKFFIIDDCKLDCDNIINVTKASNGETHRFFYPYDKTGKPLELNDINEQLVQYMLEKADKLGIDTTKPQWYIYGRTQALNDVRYKKIALNIIVRDKSDFKISVTKEQEGVYSGFYIPLYETYEDKVSEIINFIYCDSFIDYIKAVGKYKSGGYYTFSSKELEIWLNYCLENKETNMPTR